MKPQTVGIKPLTSAIYYAFSETFLLCVLLIKQICVNGYSQTSHKQTPLAPHSSVHLAEVSADGRLKLQCLLVAGASTECLLVRGVHLQEVSICRGSTVEDA